eukprot:TRINITY_DN60291_c0_g1_i1.p1 TRINITY_DN60291_c0_g1~~TRINITY_DN60291_c0_g1_i1.p1  ORF type:complete len:499 (+),score=183.93 TRINITY_DN60291_c0_g1_i1:97-1497(+)
MPNLMSLSRRLRDLGRNGDGARYNVQIYHQPAELMDDLWECIDRAEEEVLVLTYIMKDDDVGQETLARLTRAARRGVRVSLLYDDAGNITGRRNLTRELAEEPCGNVVVFRPFFTTLGQYIWSGFDFLESPVLRNHRKIVLIDNKVCYIGGLNIGNEYAGRKCTGPYLTSGKTFRDSMVKMTADPPASGSGEAPFAEFRRMIDETFAINEFCQRTMCFDHDARAKKPSWLDFLETNGDFTPPQPSDTCHFLAEEQCIETGPDMTRHAEIQLTGCDPWSRDYSLQKSIYLSAEAAQTRLWIVTPYYAPPEHLRVAIEGAAKRGVDVRLIVGGEGTTDPPIMRYAHVPWLRQALESGIRVYEYKNPGEVMHAKMFIQDSDVSSVGSYNLDMLSDRILEANLLLQSRGAAQLLAQQFLFDSSRSAPLTLQQLDEREASMSFYLASKVAGGIYATARKALGGNYDMAIHM